MKRRAATAAVATVKAKSRTTRTKDSKKVTNSNVNNAAATSSSSSSALTYFKNRQLGREFYNKDSLELSQALLGKVLVRKLPHGEIIRGTIVETEAYPGTNVDQTSASFSGKITEKKRAMYMDPGTAYVYFTYGMYHCFNISSKGEGSACLIRGIEPQEDYATMQNLRQKSRKKKPDVKQSEEIPPPLKKGRGKAKESEPVVEAVALAPKQFKMHELANGPGKLCMAFDIRRDNCDKLDMVISDEMWLENSDDPHFNGNGSFEIEASKRVGIDNAPPKARDKLWRFFIKNNFSVSTAKPSQIKKALKSADGE